MDAELKELLTLAAKACGYDLDWCLETGRPAIRDQHGGAEYWEPHLDDGDGARMEADRVIELEWYELGVVASVYYGNDTAARSLPALIRIREAYADHNNRQAARRWASLRAAAEIGKGMT